MTPEKQQEFEQINPFREIRGIEGQFNHWAEGLMSDGEIVHRLAAAASAVCYLQGIVAQTMMDCEEEVAEAKLEAAGFNPPPVCDIGKEEIPF